MIARAEEITNELLNAEAKQEHSVLMSRLVSKSPYFHRMDTSVLSELYQVMRYKHIGIKDGKYKTKE